MPVCLKCGWEILIGPGGCACTRAAKHKKAMENAARSGERIEQMMKVVDLGFTIKNDPEAPVRVEDHRKGVPEKDRVRILKIKPEKKEKRGTGKSMRKHIEPENGLKDAVERAIKEFSHHALLSKEEEILIGNAMRRALQVVLDYQSKKEPS